MQLLTESGTEFRLTCNSSPGSSDQELQEMSRAVLVKAMVLGRARLQKAPPPNGDMVQVVTEVHRQRVM